jgi:hypothetical protein
MRALLLFCVSIAVSAADLKPLPQAHAHNDYEHARPLLDALDQGFCSVEADVHLRDGVLLVAHDADQVQSGRTLENLYLAPLRERAEANGGRIYRGGPSLILLIDIKTQAEPTYAALREVLSGYKGMLTRFEAGTIHTNAVTVILSGNRPRKTLEEEKSRLASYDGRLSDLGQNHPVAFMPLVSDNWGLHFRWAGNGRFPDAEREKLNRIVARARAENRKLRFWATPDTAEAWRVLRTAGVDLINTDDLSGLAQFLRAGD